MDIYIFFRHFFLTILSFLNSNFSLYLFIPSSSSIILTSLFKYFFFSIKSLINSLYLINQLSSNNLSKKLEILSGLLSVSSSFLLSSESESIFSSKSNDSSFSLLFSSKFSFIISLFSSYDIFRLLTYLITSIL